jgi:hypothetical protein
MRRKDKMTNFLEIRCLSEKEQEKILRDIEKKIAQKIKDGIFSKREVCEIEHMKLRPLPDILDVQSVYEKLKIQGESDG